MTKNTPMFLEQTRRVINSFSFDLILPTAITPPPPSRNHALCSMAAPTVKELS